MDGCFFRCFLLINFIQSTLLFRPPSRDVCLLQVDDGPCSEDIQRFYYNTLTQECEEFSYGGCKGNNNNFKSLIECRKTCYSVPKIPRICRLRKEEGNCFAISRRYFFNMTSMKCEEFSYGGCGGNNNNFQQYFTCMEYCRPPKSVPVICHGGMDKGTGSSSMMRYFYDFTKKTCKPFEYTGSGGNNNNFVSMKDCLNVCIQKKKAHKPQATRIFRKRI